MPVTDPSPSRVIARWIVAIGFIAGGLFHLVKPEWYERIMPPFVPAPRVMVLVSGIAEIAGGVGLLMPVLRRAAAWGLIVLLVAVFPANVYMALEADRFPEVPASLLWARLPLQAVFITWVAWVGMLFWRPRA